MSDTTSPDGERIEQIKQRLNSPDRGGEDYPDYDYLWHLEAIGVIAAERSGASMTGAARVKRLLWNDKPLSPDPARIALIDTGVADHPNLRNRILWDEAIDFGSRLGGALYASGGPDGKRAGAGYAGPAAGAGGEEEPPLASLDETVSALDLTPADRGRLEELLGARVPRGDRLREITARDQRYPSHGTAAAGLVVGTPLISDGGVDDSALPFFGVDPFSQVIPIATSFEPEPGQLILALLYALDRHADVILMPRGADDPAEAPRPDPRASARQNGTRYDELQAEWALFREVLVSVSKKVPVACPAGNSGDSRIEYPARLAGVDNGIICVGAVTALGRRAGYGCYGPGMTVVAPSNDAQVYTRHQIRLDPQAPEAADHNWLIHHRPEPAFIEYAHEAPLTIDIPGPRGYRAGTRLRPGDSSDDLASLYTLFGGTSAASSIVAGVLALMRRAPGAGDVWSGPAVKKALVDSCTGSILGHRLLPDISNRTDQPGHELHQSIFGAGLVSAPAAVEAVQRGAA